MDKEEITVKQTRGTVGDRQIAYVNALKAIDYEKNWKEKYSDQFKGKEELEILADWEQMYLEQLKELGRELFDMTDEDFENNEVKSVENAEYDEKR